MPSFAPPTLPLQQAPISLGPRVNVDGSRQAKPAGGLQTPGPLPEAPQERGAFRSFKTQIYERHPELISAWHALRDRRAQRRAVEWLLDQGLIEEGAAQQFATDHPDPDLP